MGMPKSDALRKHVLELLKGKSAHADFDAAVSGFPVKRAGEKPRGAEHTAWQLLEHMRIAQRDILEFTRNPKHVSPQWPEGYWPRRIAASKDGLEQKCARLPRGFASHDGAGGRSSRRLAVAYSPRAGPDAAAGSPAGCGPQCIPSRPTGDAPASSRRVEGLGLLTRNAAEYFRRTC